MNQEILDGILIVAAFMEIHTEPDMDEEGITHGLYIKPEPWLEYISDTYGKSMYWPNVAGDDLMEACYKWDNLAIVSSQNFGDKYMELCDNLDAAACLYKALPLFTQLVANIKWYNTVNKS